MQKKFVVFDSEIDLAAHTLQMHPNRPVKRQIQVSLSLEDVYFVVWKAPCQLVL